MTSAASFDGATTAGNLTLVFSGTYVPNTVAWIEDYKYTPTLITPVNRRTNFWSSECVLDGKYPVLVHDWEIRCLVMATSTSSWISDFHDFFQVFTRTSSAINGSPQTISFNDGNSLSSVRIYLGPGYIESFELENPDSFYKSGAGVVRIKAVTSLIPSKVF